MLAAVSNMFLLVMYSKFESNIPGRGLSRQFFVQISAQNLSPILNVWVKVWTKQTKKKRVFATKIRFATKARICPIAAWTVTIRIIPATLHFAKNHAFNH